MRLIITVLLFGFGLMLGAADYELKPADGTIINSILASVNGEPISLNDILPMTRQKEYQAYAAYSGDRLYEAIRDIRRQAVDELIDRKVLLAAYQDDPFELSDLDVESEIDNTAERMGYRSRGDFIRYAREAGTSLEEIRKDIEEYLIVQIMIYRRVHVEKNITPRDVYEYYKAHSEEFVTPEKLELAMILLAPERADQEKVSAEIAAALAENPERFAEFAARYSSGPAAESGGSLGEIERRRLRPEFAAAMPNPEVGKIYGPIRTVDGISFLQITARQPEKKSDFAELGPEIRARLEREEFDKIRRSYVEELRKKAVIRLFF